MSLPLNPKVLYRKRFLSDHRQYEATNKLIQPINFHKLFIVKHIEQFYVGLYDICLVYTGYTCLLK